MKNPLENFENPWDAEGAYAQSFLNVDEVLNVDRLFGDDTEVQNIGKGNDYEAPLLTRLSNLNTLGSYNLWVASVNDYGNRGYIGELKKLENHPNGKFFKVLLVEGIDDLYEKLKVLEENGYSKLGNLFIDSHGLIYDHTNVKSDTVYFTVGDEGVTKHNAAYLSIFAPYFNENTKLILTSCNLALGNDTSSSAKLLAKISGNLGGADVFASMGFVQTDYYGTIGRHPFIATDVLSLKDKRFPPNKYPYSYIYGLNWKLYKCDNTEGKKPLIYMANALLFENFGSINILTNQEMYYYQNLYSKSISIAKKVLNIK